MRTAVRTLVTLCVVALAVFAGYQLWQYYMLTPGRGTHGSARTWWSSPRTSPDGYAS